MTNIIDLLQKSELRTDILTMAHNLSSDENYSKEDAVNDLLKFLEKHQI